MIFKEIQMDLPFINNDAISNDESVEMYQRTWKEKRRQFQLCTRCMTSMVERIMPKINTENYWKIIIECVEQSPRLECINLLGVLSVQVVFDVISFFEMNNYEKKKYVISKVIEIINRLSDDGFSELNELKQTCDTIIKSDYMNEWFWKKPIKNKGKTVQIKVAHEVDKASIYMVFKDDEKIKEVLLVEDVPDEWAYSRYLGKLEWASEDSAQLITKEGAILSGRIL